MPVWSLGLLNFVMWSLARISNSAISCLNDHKRSVFHIPVRHYANNESDSFSFSCDIWKNEYVKSTEKSDQVIE